MNAPSDPSRSDPSIDEIELEIARTRVRLADTADALADELAPQRLAREGVEMLNEFLGRPDAIKIGGMHADPVALGLIGLGVAWLVAENFGLLDGVIPGLGEHARSTSEPTVSEPIQTPAIQNSENDQSGGWFHQAANATQGAFRSVYDRSGTVIGQASDLIAHPVDSSQKVSQAVVGNPWLLGLAGLAAGAAIATLLPASRPEREIAAQAREEMWETAEGIGHRAAATVREMAEDLKEGLQHDREDSEPDRYRHKG
ncbi:MAG TPA: DUF3618 domain-containing protein [Stellaceae bacterium]|nr:DUF3618 domain-containing protein [Stellaceae bacterium]